MLRLLGAVAILFLSINLKAEETVTLVAGNSFPPLMWEENGVAKGIAVEIGKAVLEKAGYKVVVKSCPWMRCQAIAKKENAFITAFSKNDERLKNFLFSEPIMYDEIVVVTKKGREFSFNDPHEILGKRIGAQIGVGFGAQNQGLKQGMIVETDTNDVARVKKIVTGRIDGGFFSLGQVGIEYSAKLAGYSLADFTILPVVVDRDPNYLATGMKTPGAEEKIRKINAAIKALTKDGTIARLKKMTF